MLICMKTTINLNDDLLKTALIHMGLQALIEREAAKRLAALGGTMPKLKILSRLRSKGGSKSLEF